MDAKPQRPLRQVPSALYGNENAPPATHNKLHQRHKSAGNISLKTMAGPTGTLNAPAKRAAFGDLSNTSRPLGAAGPSKVKAAIAAVNARDGRVTDKENSRSSVTNVLNLPPKGNKYSSTAHISSGPSNLITKPVNRGASLYPVVKQGPLKPTPVYRDSNFQSTAAHPVVGSAVDDLAVLDKQVKNLRNYKSQPQLKTDQQALRRVQSRYLNKSEKLIDIEDVDDIDDNVTEAAYEDAVEQFSNDYAVSSDQLTAAAIHEEFRQISQVEVEPAAHFAETARQSKTYTRVMSEPEEYWEEDDEHDLYDEQGYTTAHSYRSHGDNTTGGVTTLVAPKVTSNIQRELEVAELFVMQNQTEEEQEEEMWDVSMVAEYGEDIFKYFRELEATYLPNPHYMDIQTEIQWSMRSVLMDWLVQVHGRFGLLPETLFLTVNYIDRFLSVKVVSLAKLQLVGATAILLASKYEEINCPSVQEIVFMVDKGFTCDEILKAERFMLSMLQFELGWPGPMSFLRRISKADDYELETRTLAKYFLEVTIMDERFVGCPASFLAAGAHCLSRMILNKDKGEWTLAHVHWSGYTLSQLRPLVMMIYECCKDPRKHHLAVFDKYSSSKYNKASVQVQTKVIEGWSVPYPSLLPYLSSSSSTVDDDSRTLDYNRMSLTADS